MGLGGDGGEGDGARLPERPGEADCIYYLRTGACGFGDRCRYNHPRDRGGTEVRLQSRSPPLPPLPLRALLLIRLGTVRYAPLCMRAFALRFAM